MIIKESKGNIIPFILERFPELCCEFIVTHFTPAQRGEKPSEEFFRRLGFTGDYEEHQAEYLNEYMTLDPAFYECAGVL